MMMMHGHRPRPVPCIDQVACRRAPRSIGKIKTSARDVLTSAGIARWHLSQGSHRASADLVGGMSRTDGEDMDPHVGNGLCVCVLITGERESRCLDMPQVLFGKGRERIIIISPTHTMALIAHEGAGLDRSVPCSLSVQFTQARGDFDADARASIPEIVEPLRGFAPERGRDQA